MTELTKTEIQKIERDLNNLLEKHLPVKPELNTFELFIWEELTALVKTIKRMEGTLK